MKKLMCVIFAVILSLSITASSFAMEDNAVRLSELSAEECIEFIKSYGVEIPDKYEDEMTWAPFVHYIIVQVEANPNVIFTYNYSTLHFFSNDIKQAVNNYYGIESASVQSRVVSNEPLQNNTPCGSWLNVYDNYNCYAYAIGEDKWIDPGVFDWVKDGNESADYEYNDLANAYTIAGWVKEDLEALGYTVNVVSTEILTTDVSDHTNLICVRKDNDGCYVQYQNYYFYTYDYHFMKLCENGYWYHKPGDSIPLQYHYVPSNDRVWVGEWSYGTVTKRDTDLTYDSDIYFIEYTTPHVWEVEYYGMTSDGTHQHISLCTVCGEANGDPMNCMYSTGSNICRFCGHNKNTAVGVYGLPEELQPVV